MQLLEELLSQALERRASRGRRITSLTCAIRVLSALHLLRWLRNANAGVRVVRTGLRWARRHLLEIYTAAVLLATIICAGFEFIH